MKDKRRKGWTEQFFVLCNLISSIGSAFIHISLKILSQILKQPCTFGLKAEVSINYPS
jgi:hypothetical protein